MTLLTQDKLNWLVSNPTDEIRVPANDWDDILLNNESKVVGGNVRYFQGIKIGLNVYKVKFLPPEWDGKNFGTVELDPKTEWVTKGTGFSFKKNKTCDKI